MQQGIRAMQRHGDSAESEGKRAAGPQKTHGEAMERGKVKTGGPVRGGSGDGDGNRLCDQQQGEAGRKLANIPPNMVRLCVGAEHSDDVIADLDQALRAAK